MGMKGKAGAVLELLTPEHLYAKAQHYDVNLAIEPFLIPLIKQAAVTPLPPNWVLMDRQETQDEQQDGSAGVSYKNELMGVVQEHHPADSYFLQQIQDQRAHFEQLEASGLDQQQLTNFSLDATNGWMEFEERCGDKEDDNDSGSMVTSKYYYDFVSKTRRSEHPLVRLRDSASSSVSPIADPQVFGSATTLHRQTTMKNLEQLQILCFHSWWSELSLQGVAKKRLVHIYFSIATRHFQVVLEDSNNVFTISHIVGSTGRLLTAWDLYVGARIAVLGRLTTLMQTSLLTRQWLQLHEKKFEAIKLQLQTELVKYELRDHGRPHKAGRIECADPRKSQAGTSLRQVLGDITTLKRKLAGYRPDLVRRICADIMNLDE